MDRNQAKEFYPILQAFAEGKIIEMSSILGWVKKDDLNIDLLMSNPKLFRIKPEPKYRPFKDAEECWQEMLKHKPFGWLKSKEEGYYSFITMLNYRFRLNGYDGWRFGEVINKFTFADGTTFGVKEDK